MKLQALARLDNSNHESLHSPRSLVRPGCVINGDSYIECCGTQEKVFFISLVRFELHFLPYSILVFVSGWLMIHKSEWHQLTGRYNCLVSMLSVGSGGWHREATPNTEVIIQCGVTIFVRVHYMSCAFDVALHDICGAQTPGNVHIFYNSYYLCAKSHCLQNKPGLEC